MSTAATWKEAQMFFQDSFTQLPKIGVEFLGHILIPCLTVWDTAKLFSRRAATFYISPGMHEASNVSTSTPLIFCLFLSVFYYSHPSRCEAVSLLLLLRFWLSLPFNNLTRLGLGMDLFRISCLNLSFENPEGLNWV